MKVWKTELYYKHAKIGSSDKNHFGMKLLKKLSKGSDEILDLGCGEGTRLAYLAADKRGTGVDISDKAISLARKTHPLFRFEKMNLEELSFEDNRFDLVYSAYVLEHLRNPEKVIKEAIRVTKNNGNIVFIAPNFGAPNRASPPFIGSRIKKFIRGLFLDFIMPLKRSDSLDWSTVTPKDDPKTYLPDSDAMLEPYVMTLTLFLKRKGLSIKEISTCWEEELPDQKLHQKFFKFLGDLRIYPFRFWGPHLVVAAYKY